MFIFGILPSLLAEIATQIDLKNSLYHIYLEWETKRIRDIILVLYGSFLVSFIYYLLPNKKQRFTRALPGTALVIAGWIGFTYLFKYYISAFSQLNVIYGSIVGMIISLLYFYVCSIIFIFGAEFNYSLSNLLDEKKDDS
jgi:membrane protein